MVSRVSVAKFGALKCYADFALKLGMRGGLGVVSGCRPGLLINSALWLGSGKRRSGFDSGLVALVESRARHAVPCQALASSVPRATTPMARPPING